MSTQFDYKVRDKRGQIVTGTLEGDGVQGVAARLRQMGLTPIDVKQHGTGLKMEIVLRPGHVDLKAIAVFCRQFATMINAGLPVLRCVTVLADQTESTELAKVLRKVRSDVEQGSSVTVALSRHPKTFSNLFIAMVRTGETTGALGEVLEEMAKQIETEVTLRGKIKSAMTYPIAVVGLVLIIVSALLLVVVPQFETIYKELGAPLPLPTQLLLNISSVFQKLWWIVILGIGGFVVWLRRWIKKPTGRMAFDTIKIKVPLIGPLFHKVAIARFSTTLALLLRSGVPILQALDVVKETVNNGVVSKALEEVKGSVREGESISRPLSRHPVFPGMVVQMMSVGEDSGSVDTMMSKVADFYNEEVSAAVEGLTSLIEPALITVIGVVVGASVIALYLPMFNIINLIQSTGRQRAGGARKGRYPMLQALLERRKDDRGFTLIELMIVILIIGILISVGLPTFLGARERAQDRAAQAQLRNGMAAAKTFYTDSNTYTGFDVTAATAIEPSIPWVAATTEVPLQVSMAVSTSPAGAAVTLVTKSAAGLYFCLKDVSGASSGNGTFYSKGTTSACGSYYTTTTGWLATPSGATSSPGA